MWMDAILAWSMSLVVGQIPPTTGPGSQPTSQPASRPMPPVEITRILDDMEAVGNKVEDLRCRVDYAVRDLVGLAEFTKFGEIVYKRTRPNPHFKITFDRMHEGGVVVRKKEWYLFAMRWFYEAKESSRTIIRREVIREGEVVDLFDLEKSPFPIPFGQRKDEILRHFDVASVPAVPGDPKDTDHLVCVPKTGSRLADDYSRLEFFVSRELHLPVKIIATESDPDGQASKIITAVFPDLSEKSINIGLPLNTFQLPQETSQFQLIDEPLAPSVPKKPGM